LLSALCEPCKLFEYGTYTNSISFPLDAHIFID